jgi:hypothetical protein
MKYSFCSTFYEKVEQKAKRNRIETNIFFHNLT